MTHLRTRKTKARAETCALWRGRPLVIELGQHSILIREKGRRHYYEVPYTCIFEVGAKLAARQRAREKAELRRKGRNG